MTAIFLLQLFLPVLFIGLLALATPTSKLGFLCQTVGTAIAMLALALTGLWLFPPWWTPYIFGGLLAAATVVNYRRRHPFKSRLPLG